MPRRHVVKGKITNKGRTMSISIPQELRPAGGLDATLTGIDADVQRQGQEELHRLQHKCPKGSWKVGSTFEFTNALDGAPAPRPQSTRGQGEVLEVAPLPR